MRLTEAQIRRTVRRILNEALPAYPEPDRGIAKIIDAIGLKLKSQAESDPDFEPMRDAAARRRLITRTFRLVAEKYRREIDQIRRLMVRQAQKLEEVIEATLPDIVASLTPRERKLYNINQFQGIHSESAEDSLVILGIQGSDYAIVHNLVHYIFPTPSSVPGFEADRLSRSTDHIVYGSLLRLYGYHAPEHRSTAQAFVDAENEAMAAEPGFLDED